MFKFNISGLLLLLIFFLSCQQNQPSKNGNKVIDSLQASVSNEYTQLDQSPMDMSYFPSDYPLQKMNRTDTTGPVARVIYSRPHKKGRVIFGDTQESLCQYGKEWRLGANEATEIELFKNVNIAGKNIAKGRYILYCIPFADKWTIILNSNLYTWGLHMDNSMDIFKIDIPVTVQTPFLEDFTIVFESKQYGADLIMAWDNVKTSLPLDFIK